MVTESTAFRSRDSARVWCSDCEYAWFGSISAHGLSILGHCPRCGGHLEFREKQEPEAAPRAAREEDDAGLQPWEVMGAPNRW